MRELLEEWVRVIRQYDMDDEIRSLVERTEEVLKETAPKKRGRRGKLSESDIEDIATSDLSATELSEKYGVTTSYVYSIRNSRNSTGIT